MIKDVGDMQNMFNRFDTADWVRSANFENDHRLNMDGGIISPSEVNQQNFTQFLANSLAQVNQLQQDANVAVEQLATGKSQALHETMLMVEQAEIAFKTMNQLRQKVIDAYREVMKLQI